MKFRKFFLVGLKRVTERSFEEVILDASTEQTTLLNDLISYADYENVRIVKGKVILGTEYFDHMNRTFQKAQRRQNISQLRRFFEDE